MTMKEIKLSKEEGIYQIVCDDWKFGMPAHRAMGYELDERVKFDGQIFRVIGTTIGAIEGFIELWPVYHCPDCGCGEQEDGTVTASFECKHDCHGLIMVGPEREGGNPITWQIGSNILADPGFVASNTSWGEESEDKWPDTIGE